MILSDLGILFYAFLAGFEPSIVRAAIMGILVFMAQLTGRQNSAFLGLFSAGFIMLFVNPSLIFDIGFQLSFMATLGLIYIRPIFFRKKNLKKLIEKSVVGEDVATTISAQIATLPILLANFGSFSFSSILVNALVLWTVPVIMIIGGISALLGLIFAPIGQILAYISIPFLLYFETVVDFFGARSSQLTIDHLPLTIFFGYYLILFSIILRLRKR